MLHNALFPTSGLVMTSPFESMKQFKSTAQSTNTDHVLKIGLYMVLNIKLFPYLEFGIR